MSEIILWCVAGLLAMNFVLMLLVLKQKLFSRGKIGDLIGQDDLQSFKKELSKAQREIQEDIQKAHQSTTKTMTANIGEFGKLLTSQSEGMRSAVGMRFQDLQQSTEARLDKIRDAVANQLSSGAKAIIDLMHSNETSMEHVRSAVDMRLQPYRQTTMKSWTACARPSTKNSSQPSNNDWAIPLIKSPSDLKKSIVDSEKCSASLPA